MQSLHAELGHTVTTLEETLRKKEVAKTIASQFDRNELWAIGAQKLQSLSSSKFGGLMFNASLFGRKKCVVAILLTGDDLYNIAVYIGKNLTCIGSAKGVFAEDMTCQVVNIVEKRFAA